MYHGNVVFRLSLISMIYFFQSRFESRFGKNISTKYSIKYINKERGQKKWYLTNKVENTEIQNYFQNYK